MTPKAPAVEHAPRPWEAGAGLAPADAVMLFTDAACIQAWLGGELDASGRRGISPDVSPVSATERRRLVHASLDRALDVAELLEALEQGNWP